LSEIAIRTYFYLPINGLNKEDDFQESFIGPLYAIQKINFLKNIKRRWAMNIASNTTFMDKIRHLFNPLHLYCKLTDCGMSKKVALDICKTYEACVYKRTLGR
jgi:hypothetical protein